MVQIKARLFQIDSIVHSAIWTAIWKGFLNILDYLFKPNINHLESEPIQILIRNQTGMFGFV